MSGLGDRGEQDTYKIASERLSLNGIRIGRAELTLETDTVALQAVHGLSEEVLPGGRHSGDIILLPLNWGIDVFEDLLDRVGNFSSDTVPRNQRDLCHIEC